MTHLYEITENARELQKLAELSDESDETMAQAIADTWEAIEGEFKEKAISLVHVTKLIATDADAIDAEIKRLQARKKAYTNKIESLKNYLRVNMEASDISKIECPLFTITLGKPRDVVVIDDESKIPADYLKIETLQAPMKKEILDALKSGEDVAGCSLGKSKSSVFIR